MAASNHIRNVAIVGAGGNAGSFMTKELLKTGKHTVTAITRVGSETKFPDELIVKQIDYSKPETLIDAFRGQDALIITLGTRAAHETQFQLINAAAEANVSWILPNEWSPDTSHEGILEDVIIFPPKKAARKAIEDLGKSSYVAVSTGFWYEWSLAMIPAFGVDLVNRTAILFDEGETRISISTWPQVGRAVAALLSLPIKSEGSNQACLENHKNQLVFVSSFTVNQKEMLESVYRVTDTKPQEWTITKEPVRERYAAGFKEHNEVKEGPRAGLAKMVYSRIFFDDGCGDVEHNKGTINSVLGLPKEDIDEATNAALEFVKTFTWS